MKRAALAVVAALILSLFAMSGIASAEDKLLNAKADNVVIAKGKNNKEYVRVTVIEDRQISGVKYQMPVSIMFFGNLVEQAKKIKTGQNVKCVVQARDFQGRTSYTAVALTGQQ